MGELKIRKRAENTCADRGVKEDLFFLHPSALSPSQNLVCFQSRGERLLRGHPEVLPNSAVGDGWGKKVQKEATIGRGFVQPR